MTDKAYRIGTHRAIAPEQTLENVKHRLFDGFGITRIADITGLDRVGIPVMAAYRPDARSLAVSMGKGATPAAARASAVMESIELWHAEHCALAQTWGSANELERRHRLIEWSALPQIARAAFSAETLTAWVEANSMTDGETTLVPYECVHTDGRFPEPAGSGWFHSTSNGLASGNTLAEAKVHALCEVIERDAITLWRLSGGLDETAIDPRTVSDALCRDLISHAEAAGLVVLLQNATSDIGICVVHCTLVERDTGADLTIYATSGMGCHPCPAVALSRAVTEAAQSRLTLISGARDDLYRARYVSATEGARQLGPLRRAAACAHVHFDELRDHSTPTLEGDLEVVLEALLSSGLKPYWADLSLSHVGIPVGRAVVPGLELLNDIEPFHPGLRATAAQHAASDRVRG